MITQKIPDPPGGRLKCEIGQMAVVDVDTVTNEVHASCRTPPPGKGPNDGSPRAFSNWALSEILGRERRSDRPISEKEKVILKQGSIRFRNDKGVEIVRMFKLPTQTTFRGNPGPEGMSQKKRKDGGEDYVVANT